MRDILTVRWRKLSPDRADPMREWRGVLYAYVATTRRRDLLYLGKAWGCTVHERMVADDKARLYEEIQRWLPGVQLYCVVGELILRPDERLTHQLVQDVESLLILQLQPRGNKASRQSRSCARPGLVVRNVGDWWAQGQVTDHGGWVRR